MRTLLAILSFLAMSQVAMAGDDDRRSGCIQTLDGATICP